MRKPTILIVNDDGIYGPGLRPLIQSLKKIGSVTIVVPDQERSADSHGLTLHKPLRVREVSKDFYILNGSPADCARFGILEILKEEAHLVASGINQGFNMGEDVVYSGTVAAAMEATQLKIPAFAISQGIGPRQNYDVAAQFARRLAQQMLRRGLPDGIALNVNVPNASRERARPTLVTRLGKRVYGKKVTVRSDPRGHQYFWLTGKNVLGIALPGSDVAAIGQNSISVTPLHIDNTDLQTIHLLKKWDL
ncbi:MAG: 5'/3'-nucleotidase SurE [Elusimicrobia bacterium]|nr:5'/3'-nucleotidase SurE [Elusimicrobiota bacterium]